MTTWRYENFGTADLLLTSGTTLTNLPETKSNTGSAFYQTERIKIFDIPDAKELWVKFDVFTTISTRWRALNDGTSGSCGILSQTTKELYVMANSNRKKTVSNVIKNTLQTVLLHMVSDSSAGVVEAWIDGSKRATFTGNVNNGEDFTNFFLNSDGAQTFFSNVIISNAEIGLNENVAPIGFPNIWIFDTQRAICRLLSLNFDTERILQNNAFQITVAENFDTHRKITRSTNFFCDIERYIVRTVNINGDTQRIVQNLSLTAVSFYVDTERRIAKTISFAADTQRVVQNTSLADIVNVATSVLLHFDDENDLLKDECGNNWTAYGNYTESFNVTKFGGHYDFNGVDQYLKLENLQLGGKDFTIDGWFYVSSAPTSTQTIFSITNDAFAITGIPNSTREQNYYYLDLQTDKTLWFSESADGDYGNYAESSVLSEGWHHFAVVHQFNLKTTSFFVDGVLQKSYDLPNADYKRRTLKVVLGVFDFSTVTNYRNDPVRMFYEGALDEFRIVDGVALWTENFTPPTAPMQLIKVNLLMDTERIIGCSVNFFCDAERKIPHKLIFNPPVNGVFTDDTNSTGIQSIEISINAQQLTDQLSFTSTNSLDIMQQVKGNYLDYDFDMRIEFLTQRGGVCFAKCCSDIDEILYTQLNYKVPEVDYSQQKWHTPDTGTTTTSSQNNAVPPSKMIFNDKNQSVSTTVINYPEEPTEEDADKQPKALASVHARNIARALGKQLITSFNDFTSTVDTEAAGVTYNDLIDEIFGWSFKLPHLAINCYLRDDKLFIIQRGYEQNTVDLTNEKYSLPTVSKQLIRTFWANTPYTKTETRTLATWGWVSHDSGNNDDEEEYENNNTDSRGYEFDDDGLIKRTVRTDSNQHTETDYEYITLSNGKKFLSREITKIYEGNDLIDTQTLEHTPFGQGQRHSYATGSDGEYLGSGVGRGKDNDKISRNGGFDNLVLYWENYKNQLEERTVPGITLFDTSFRFTANLN